MATTKTERRNKEHETSPPVNEAGQTLPGDPIEGSPPPAVDIYPDQKIIGEGAGAPTAKPTYGAFGRREKSGGRGKT